MDRITIVTGSHLWGWPRENSDYDTHTVALYPVKRFSGDNSIYPIGDALYLAAKSINHLGPFFSPGINLAMLPYPWDKIFEFVRTPGRMMSDRMVHSQTFAAKVNYDLWKRKGDLKAFVHAARMVAELETYSKHGLLYYPTVYAPEIKAVYAGVLPPSHLYSLMGWGVYPHYIRRWDTVIKEVNAFLKEHDLPPHTYTN